MSDLISRKDAIAEFSCCELTPDGGIDVNYAIDFLKQLPSAQPETNCSEFPNNSDTISRQAAIDALGEEPPVWYDGEDEIAERNQWRRAVKAIKAVPSAQPDACKNTCEIERKSNDMSTAQPEIIRCTECKHYREYDSKYVENAVVVQCMADRYPISETIPDGWFCAGAERKDDE